MPGNPLVRFDEGRVGRTARCRPLSYSTERLYWAGMSENAVDCASLASNLYEAVRIDIGFHADLIIENQVSVEAGR